MKKQIALLLAAAAVFSLTACTAKKDKPDDSSAAVFSTNPVTLPSKDDLLFGDVPRPDAQVTMCNKGMDDYGFVYQWEFKGMDYKDFKSYVEQLKKADFAYYSTMTYSINPEEEPTFAAKEKDCNYTASWLGVRRGFFVTVMWYGDEFFEKNNITGPNCRVMFYTYNPFRLPETTAKSETTTKAK